MEQTLKDHETKLAQGVPPSWFADKVSKLEASGEAVKVRQIEILEKLATIEATLLMQRGSP